ncbi:MAG TPA: type VI secretion system baseplate subunit TssF [Rubrivivax sp.]|nr:type VI secretion system baseplate subunit TssF [Rubrivivax sp.]
MDPRLTRLYQDELIHLREMGREFARNHPKIASRLGMEALEVADPYVERLLEGFAFLTARVQLKLEAEQPRLIAQLLDALYPNFLAPVPSMAIMQMGVDVADPNLARGHLVLRGTTITSLLPRGQNTRCEFRTAMDVTLWPLELVQAQYFSFAPDLPLARLPQARPMKGGLRLRLRCGGGLRFDQLGLQRLGLFISAADDVAYRLHELVLGTALGSLVMPVPGTAPPGTPPMASPQPGHQWRGPESILPVGYEADQALLPESLRSFSGHRLLQEVAALPQRLLFFEIDQLAPRLAQCCCTEVDLVVAFARGDPNLEALVDSGSLALFCTPAINLFERRLDRVSLGPGTWEYHLVPDRTRPMDLEVHSVQSVFGHGLARSATGDDTEGPREFKPLYASRHDQVADGHGYYTLRREPRRASDRQRLQGARVPSYLGEEVFVSLVDAGHGPYRESLRQLSVNAWVTNRDLPALLPPGSTGGERAWQIDLPGPVSSLQCLRGPTRPVSRQPVGAIGWKLVSQVTQNHLALGDSPEVAAAVLRDSLRLYGAPNDVAWGHQADGLRSLQAHNAVRRLPFAGPLSFGTGTELTLEVDEQAFQGSSAFLMGCLLECYLARQAAINSFTQFTLKSVQRGVIKAWPPRVGLRPIL